MSQPWQQPAHNQPAAPYGAPMPPAARQGNAGLAVLAGVVATVIGAVIYAYILKATFNEDKGEVRQIGYVAILLGALVGAAVGKIGGRNPGMWAVGAVLALAGILLGELYGYALIIDAKITHGAMSANEVFFKHFGDLVDTWKKDLNGLSYFYFVLAPVGALGAAKRLGD